MKKSYKDEYEKYANLFWDLQQQKQTPEEEEYLQLCQELLQKAESFRQQISDLAEENDRLTKEVANNPEDQKYEMLIEREQLLTNILSSYK